MNVLHNLRGFANYTSQKGVLNSLSKTEKTISRLNREINKMHSAIKMKKRELQKIRNTIYTNY